MGKSVGANASTVCEYLQRQNRPYSATDLHNNLKSIPKTQILKALQELVDVNSVVQKTYGKQSVFVYNQNDIPIDQQELKDNLKQVENLSQNVLPDLKRHVSSLSSSLQSALQHPSTANAKLILKELKEKVKNNTEKLSKLKQTDRPLMSPKEIKELDQNVTVYQQIAKKRKRIFYDVINCMTEAADISPKALMEELGCELPPI